ncbi:MAG: TonB-dependent receptor [Burkholderiaceae bacterium]|nr:TonB-dependent receptor [Burkholderiaceae bacterium]
MFSTCVLAPPIALAQSEAIAAADPHADANQTRTLERVTVTGGRPSTLPLEIPTTTEGITGEQIERRINATDSSDALKYFPSLVVRKRNIGDYDHAVLASRASGTGNSARSLVFADGILLSNLLGNGAEFTPRWGLVTPEEIERVDVLYGPFSAAYSGNSAGAIVDYVTRMPTRFEAHLKVQAFTQDYRLYGTDERFSGHQGSASLGDRSGNFSWWLHLNRLDSDGQPLVIARVNRSTTPNATGTPVTGAVADRNNFGVNVWNVGTTAQTDTRQDNAKLKLAYDFSPTLRASYTLAQWRNEAERSAETYLHDATGNRVYSGKVNIGGSEYTVPALAPSRARLEHIAQGLTIKSNTRGTWDWEAAASLYDYDQDHVRSPVAATVLPGALSGGAGRVVDQGGTGWNTLALKGIWRPSGVEGDHIVEFGVQRDAFKLRRRESNAANWIGGSTGSLAAAFSGETTLTSLWAQDAWRFAPQWRAVLGGRYEQWKAEDGHRTVGAVSTAYISRDESAFSPKAAISFDVNDDWTLKASIGRAVRNPTVNELFQGAINTTTGLPTLNNPNLRPEKSVTTELTAERALPHGLLRTTVFIERSHDALYSQTTVGGTQVQNVGRIDTKGIELAFQSGRVLVAGLELSGSVTYADSEIRKNDGFPDTVGKRQPRVPDWRGSLLASYTLDEYWAGSLGARFSGKQFGQLNNSDTNGFAYQGFSRYFVADVRVQYRIDRQWRASFGIDNLNNEKYWAFHPYPQRTLHAEIRFDY